MWLFKKKIDWEREFDHVNLVACNILEENKRLFKMLEQTIEQNEKLIKMLENGNKSIYDNIQKPQP